MAPAPILSHMAPLKKILFIGRIGLDTGYDACVELAKLLKLKLTVITDKPNAHDFITRTDYVFVSGYLTIIEAALSRKLIFVGYNNRNALRKAIRRTLDDASLCKKLTQGGEHTVQKFTKETMLTELTTTLS